MALLQEKYGVLMRQPGAQRAAGWAAGSLSRHWKASRGKAMTHMAAAGSVDAMAEACDSLARLGLDATQELRALAGNRYEMRES